MVFTPPSNFNQKNKKSDMYSKLEKDYEKLSNKRSALHIELEYYIDLSKKQQDQIYTLNNQLDEYDENYSDMEENVKNLKECLKKTQKALSEEKKSKEYYKDLYNKWENYGSSIIEEFELLKEKNEKTKMLYSNTVSDFVEMDEFIQEQDRKLCDLKKENSNKDFSNKELIVENQSLKKENIELKKNIVNIDDMNTTIIRLREIIQKKTEQIDNIKKQNRTSYVSDSDGDLYDDFCMIDDRYVKRVD